MSDDLADSIKRAFYGIADLRFKTDTAVYEARESVRKAKQNKE